MSEEKWLAEEVEAFSNNLEGYISAFYNDPTWKALRDRAARLVAAKLPNRQISVLDLGSGPMPSLPGLYERSSRYVCVEPSKQFADHLYKYYPNITIIQESIEELVQHKKESFDVVLCFGVLHHIYSPTEVVGSISGWVDKGGIFVTHDPSIYWNDKMGSPNERGFTRQELLSMIKPYFNDVQIYTHHLPVLHRSIYRLLSALKLWQLIRSQKLGKLVIELEFALDKLGVSGTNFLVIATVADIGLSSFQSTT